MSDTKPARCPQCGVESVLVHDREITRIGWDPRARRKVVQRTRIAFCSPKCGGDYQMGCEG